MGQLSSSSGNLSDLPQCLEINDPEPGELIINRREGSREEEGGSWITWRGVKGDWQGDFQPSTVTLECCGEWPRELLVFWRREHIRSPAIRFWSSSKPNFSSPIRTISNLEDKCVLLECFPPVGSGERKLKTQKGVIAERKERRQREANVETIKQK